MRFEAHSVFVYLCTSFCVVADVLLRQLLELTFPLALADLLCLLRCRHFARNWVPPLTSDPDTEAFFMHHAAPNDSSQCTRNKPEFDAVQ